MGGTWGRRPSGRDPQPKGGRAWAEGLGSGGQVPRLGGELAFSSTGTCCSTTSSSWSTSSPAGAPTHLGTRWQMLGRRWAQGLGAKETVPACLLCPLDCQRLQPGGSERAEERHGPRDLFLREFGVLSVRSVDPGPGACGADSPVRPPARLSCRRQRCPACGRTSPFSRNRRFLILPFTLFHDREFHECSDSNVNELPSSD